MGTAADHEGRLELGDFLGLDRGINVALHNKGRHYDPKPERFRLDEPIRFAGGANVYTYALDNPGHVTDPLGLEVWPEDVPNGPIGGTVGCFLEGVAVGSVTGAVVIAAAAGAVYVGVPVALITAVLGVTGAVGGGLTVAQAANEMKTGNYDGLAYTLGSVTGGAIAGAAGATSVPGVDPKAPWTSSGGKGFNPKLGSIWDWLGKGPDKASAAGAVGGTAAGAALACGCSE